MKNLQGKAVVLDGHTLGVVLGDLLQILRASVKLGSPFSPSPLTGCVPLTGDYRLATPEDFETFRVMPHPDYFAGR